MKNKNQLFLAGQRALGVIISLGMIGCVSVPPVHELTQLDGNELRAKLPGNTWTSNYEWGLWAQYYVDDRSGLAKASGDWGTEVAASIYSISDDGEGCWSYDGGPKWADASNIACAVVLVDDKGNLYSKSTKNDLKPERVGKLRKIEIKAGDTYGLSE